VKKRVRPGHCPGCDAVASAGADNPWRPFCSERCKLADLGQWFAGRYSIPVDDDGAVEQPQEPQSRQ
jgi:endogenous inhibitor of DNA gyrase (YacG/DUF329 family)